MRRGYDEATKQRDARLSSLAAKTTDAAAKVEAAWATATQAADTASKAADKVTERSSGKPRSKISGAPVLSVSPGNPWHVR